MSQIKYKLKRVEDYSFSQLEEEINRGARFVVFPYTISLIVVSLTPFSKAYLIKANENVKMFSQKYSLLSGFFGWWGIPHGMINTMRSIRMNKQGGLDVTADIMANLTNESFEQQEVEIKKIVNLFMPFTRSDRKELSKALKRFRKTHPEVNELIIGRYLNVEEGENPIMTVGLPILMPREIEKEFDECVRKYFYKHVPFWYLSLQEDNEIVSKLKEQGEVIRI